MFHSNSHIAAGPLLKRIRDQGETGKKALDEYIQALSQQQVNTERFKVPLRHLDSQTYDGTLFYPDRLHEVFEESSTVPEKKQSEAVRKAV